MASSLANRTGLRPGSSIVVPSLSRGLWAAATDKPTRGSRVDAVSTSGSQMESNPRTARSSTNCLKDAAVPPDATPVPTPMRTFIVLDAGPSTGPAGSRLHQGWTVEAIDGGERIDRLPTESGGLVHRHPECKHTDHRYRLGDP